MGTVINLRQARKRKARADKAANAAANRALHGRTKAERSAQAAQDERQNAVLRGAFRESPQEKDQ
ncbi:MULTISPECIES: DUF4169 family protein [Sphingobium]|jgi:hypothetical protein|uniref:DUF4169 family protein n=1 Tax=Sphingobium TaxID=165695 RepID=UPI000C570756|nr:MULTISPECIES: DUF4169 family protein [Sphingobium]MAP45893.1 hypothetical protein [Sphingobium sp.]MBA38646.1 hypothetical protein [Sphingobium sp.]MBS49296.1 hypothetical protein [Sphingobium sp.]MCC4257314.1 DUF4169 family protein [Sphingobium lactosutens]|tara:strand:- start:95 stop:289 length:195 start_codon:yes stop_codon:yes gene_type:complete